MVPGGLTPGLELTESPRSHILETQVERFDRWPLPRQAGRTPPPWIRTLIGLGLATIVAGLLLVFLLPSSSWVPVEILPIVFGGMLEALILGGWVESRRAVTEVSISDKEVRFTSRNGAVNSAQWDSRPVFVRLWRTIENPPGTPVRVDAWTLNWGKIRADVSDEIARALMRRARRLGLRVTEEPKRWPGWKGRPMVVEVVNFRDSPG